MTTSRYPLPSTSDPRDEQAQRDEAGHDPRTREEQAKNLCLRLLTARARTRAELAGKLTQRGYPDEVSARVLDRLATAGLVDDADFAEQWVRSRQVNAGKGKRALAAELRTKGVDDDVIADALRDVTPAAERERAEELVQAKLRRESLDGDHTRVVRRLVAMLARRGYSSTMAFDVVQAELALELDRRRT